MSHDKNIEMFEISFKLICFQKMCQDKMSIIHNYLFHKKYIEQKKHIHQKKPSSGFVCIKLLANGVPAFWHGFFVSPFWNGLLWKYLCLTSFAPEKNLRSFTTTIFGFNFLTTFLMDICDTNGFKYIRREASPALDLLPSSASKEPYFNIQATIKSFLCDIELKLLGCFWNMSLSSWAYNWTSCRYENTARLDFTSLVIRLNVQ